MSDSQGWHGWDDAQVAADAEAVKGDDGFLKMEAREEPYIVRFLPAKPTEESAIKVVWQHYIEFPDKSKFVFNCPKMMQRLHCDGCDLVERLYETGSSNDEKLAKRFAPKVRVFSRLILREAEEKGPRIFPFGKMIFDELKLLRKNPRQGGDFTDPTDKGYDIEIYVTGEGMERRYKPYPGNRSPLASPEQVAEWMDLMPSLDKLGKILPPDAIRAGLRIGQAPVAALARVAEPARLSTQAAGRTLESRATTPARPTRKDNSDPIF